MRAVRRLLPLSLVVALALPWGTGAGAASPPEARASKACGSISSILVYRVRARKASCRKARRVARAFTTGTGGCSGRFDSYCGGYHVLYIRSFYTGGCCGRTYLVMNGRASGGRRISWRYWQRGE